MIYKILKNKIYFTFSSLSILLILIIVFTYSFNSPLESAISKANEKIEAKDYKLAYDYLLAAMLINPESPKVFDKIKYFIESSIKSDSDDDILFAYDLYSRLDKLIPYQTISSIEDKRIEYENLLKLFEEDSSDQSSESLDEFSLLPTLNSISSQIANLDIDHLPIDVSTISLQKIRSDLESIAIDESINSSTNDSNYWKEWSELNANLDGIELKLLNKLYSKIRKEYHSWESMFQETKEKALNNEDEYDFVEIKNIESLIEKGYILNSNINNFVLSGDEDAANDNNDMEKHLEELNKIKYWLHNKNCLFIIKEFKKDESLSEKSKLEELSNIDENNLSPYIHGRYQEYWNYLFEELNDADKVFITKHKIIKGL